MSNDITFCVNKKCTNKECERNLKYRTDVKSSTQLSMCDFTEKCRNFTEGVNI